MSSDRPVRVRFAPSPTGRLHIGGARTALFNWAYARRHGGAFLLRIEDTDEERNTEESLQSILSSLRWLGLQWDEGPEVGGKVGPYFQKQRLASYRDAAARLLAAGRLYRCFCTGERLEKLREEQQAAGRAQRYDRRCRGLSPAEAERRAAAGEACALRVATPAGREILVHDLIRGEVRFPSDEVEDWVALRTSGMPTYNYCCVVDDAAMNISHVLRGEEHLINTPKQALLYDALGLPQPLYGHLPLILGQDGRKLSKRTGDTAVEDYRAKGYPPEAIFNFLCLLGFSIDDHTEIFGPAEMAAAFDLGRVGKSGAVFDLDKLHWLCGEYVRRTPLAELAERLKPWLRDAGLLRGGESEDWLRALTASIQERIRLYSEAPAKLAPFFQDAVQPDAEAGQALAAAGARELLAAAAAALAQESAFPPADFDAWVKAFVQARGLGAGKLLKPMRAALTGTLGGPPVVEILRLLGRERALQRLRG